MPQMQIKKKTIESMNDSNRNRHANFFTSKIKGRDMISFGQFLLVRMGVVYQLPRIYMYMYVWGWGEEFEWSIKRWEVHVHTCTHTHV